MKGLSLFKYNFLLITSFVLIIAQGCADALSPRSEVPTGRTSLPTSKSKRDVVVRSARSHLGDGYKHAGDGPNKWDCSGLTHYSYKKAGINIKRFSSGISEMAKGVNISKAQKGDLVFFKKEGRVFHVAIITKYSGGQLWAIHSTSSRGVVEEDLYRSPYWKNKLFKVISLASLSKSK